MPFDGVTLSILIEELKEKLTFSRVMKIYQPHRDTLIFHLRMPRTTHKLLLSSCPLYPRIHTTEEEYPNPKSPPAFCMLLRKYLEPSRILQIEQLGLERIVRITFETLHDLTLRTKHLYFELMGRHSNITLVSDSLVLDAIRRSSPDKEDRPLFPGAIYEYPSSQNKREGKTLEQEEFVELIRFLPGNLTLSDGLSQNLLGISTTAAEEIVTRAKLPLLQQKMDTGPLEWNLLYQALQDFFLHPGSPILYQKKGKEDFVGYQLTNYPGLSFSSLDALVDTFYSQKKKREEQDQRASHLTRMVKNALGKVEKKARKQQEELAQAKDREEFQILGELLTSNLHLVKKGATSVFVENYYSPTLETLEIPLDPKISGPLNAKKYFKLYAKAKNARKITALQLAHTLSEQEFLEEMLLYIDMADSLSLLETLKEELEKRRYLPCKGKSKAPLKAQPLFYEYEATDGTRILVGRSTAQNDHLTFKVAKPQDLWFHAQKVPGSHVVIKTQGAVSPETLHEAALLAAYYSKARQSPKVLVDYTERKHVKKPPSAPPGFVIYEDFASLLVDPTTGNLPKKKRP